MAKPDARIIVAFQTVVANCENDLMAKTSEVKQDLHYIENWDWLDIDNTLTQLINNQLVSEWETSSGIQYLRIADPDVIVRWRLSQCD